MNIETSLPSPWVVRFAQLLPPSSQILDLACGSGRHSRYLAQLGHHVLAVDRDVDALATLADIDGIDTLEADLENRPWPVFGRLFHGIVITNYLWRPLAPMVMASLEPGGILIHETFMLGQEKLGRPSNPAFLLRSGELLDVVRQRLTVLAFEQGMVSEPRPAVIQRICAIRGEAGLLPSSVGIDQIPCHEGLGGHSFAQLADRKTGIDGGDF